MFSSVEELEQTAARLEKELAELEAVPEDKPKRGRPSKMTPQVVTKLVAAFNMGYNDTEAALYAGISRKTYYDWLLDNPDFRNKINKAKTLPSTKAKEVIVNALNSGDMNAAKWWLERKAANEFSTKPLETSDIPPELEEHLNQLKEIIRLTEQRICFPYRNVIFGMRERERANAQNSRGNKTNTKESIYTRLLELPDNELADYIQQEVTATGNDLAGVRELLVQRIDHQSYYRRELDRVKHWNDLD
jgi:succinate dehydrogenase flavin-adding protein (antitoxin of CptAB toxin-antitoxin module)